MLQIHNLSKSYGSQTLFDGVTFTLTRGERVGIVGRNGHGKSTLFRLILGEEERDGGDISIPRGYTIGHLPQTIVFTAPTLLEETCLGLPVDKREEQFRAERILMGLGFTEEHFAESPHTFSGGFQLRIVLAKLLLSEPDLLLLDEPTNYLDIVSVRWLTKELREWPGELMLISHDRDFMDRVTTHTMAIHRQKVRKVPGPTEKLYALLAQEEEVYERTRLNEEKKRDEILRFVNRFRAQASKASLVQSRLKELDRRGPVEKLQDIETLDFSFTESPFPAKNLLECRNLAFSYDSGPLLFNDLSLSVEKRVRIGVIGKNGRGKSTLLKILAGELAPTEGEVSAHERTAIGYFGQTNVLRLNLSRTIEDEVWSVNPTLSRTKVRSLCGAMMFSGDAAEKKISVLSGGERSRVLLAKLLATPTNLLLLDEPTSHLDMESIDALVDAVHAFNGSVIIVTHSEEILRACAERLIVFTSAGAELFEGTYDEFLERRGWEDEATGPSRGLKSSGGSARRDRGGDKERERRLRKSAKELSNLQSRFDTLDREVTETQDRLLREATTASPRELAELSAKVERLEEEQLGVLEQIEALKRVLEEWETTRG